MTNIAWEINESRGYLDLPSFKKYTERVKDTIDTLYKREKRPLRVAEIKRELGKDLVDRQLYDALDALCGVGSIVLTSDVSPIRFAPQEIPKTKLLTYQTGPAAKADKSRPSIQNFGRGGTF